MSAGVPVPERTVEEPHRLKHRQKKMASPGIPIKRKVAAGAEKSKKSQTPDYITWAVLLDNQQQCNSERCIGSVPDMITDNSLDNTRLNNNNNRI